MNAAKTTLTRTRSRAEVTEVTIHLQGGHVQDVHFDGAKEGTAINAFLLLTNVPVDPPAGHILVYGNSDRVGRMILSLWRHSCKENPEGAWVIEEVAKAIVAEAERLRGEWPGEGTGPGIPM